MFLSLKVGMLVVMLAADGYAFENITLGTAVPAFKLECNDGSSFDSQKKLTGKPYVISFVRPNQAFSEKLLGDLESLAKLVAVVVVCSEKDLSAEIKGMAQKVSRDIPVLLDLDRTLYGKMGVVVAPATGFVDAKGMLRFYFAGYRSDFTPKAAAAVDLIKGVITEDAFQALISQRSEVAPQKMNRANANYQVGMKLVHDGRFSDAKEEFKRAIEKEPGHSASLLQLGTILLRENDNNEALKYFESVLQIESDNQHALAGKGAVLLRTGNANEGTKLLQDAIEKVKLEPMFYYELGKWYMENNDTNQASRFLKQGLESVLGY